jgi:short-subunit dehydrogenase
MAKREIQDCRAILTGASSGIGRALAVELARRDAKLVAVARRAERLQELAAEVAAAGRSIETVAGDVSDPAVRQQALDAAMAHFGGLDLLVNNAGIGAMGLFEHADPQRLRRVMEVNFFALVEMTRLCLPQLKQGRRPMIVNVSSILGHRGVPHSSEYSASKFAVQGFSEALRAELAQHGVEVLVVSPGTTETEFFERVIERTSSPKWPEHKPVSPAYVAQQVVRGIRCGQHEVIPYRWGKVLCWLNRLSPGLVDRLMQRYA